MTIPQVNAGATACNREQTKRICELKGWRYAKFDGYTKAQMPVDCKDGRCNHDISVGRCHEAEDLPNGSFTLCQVVGMLEEYMDAGLVQFEEDFGGKWRVAVFAPCDERGVQKILGEYLSDNPLNLTMWTDALIKVLEAKQ